MAALVNEPVREVDCGDPFGSNADLARFALLADLVEAAAKVDVGGCFHGFSFG